MIRTLATVPVVLPLLVFASACGDDGEQNNGKSTASGICALTVKFDNTYYTAGGDLTDPERGRRLGTASQVSCAEQDADGPPDSDLILYAIRGVSPSEAVLAEDPEIGGDPVVLVVEVDPRS